MVFKKINSNGFALTEVLMAGILLSIFISAFTQMFANNLKATRSIQSMSDTQTLSRDIYILLNNPDACAKVLMNGQNPPSTAAFNPDVPPAPADQFQSIQINGNVMVAPGQTYPNFVIQSLTLTEADKNLRAVLSATEIRYYASLQIKYEKTGQTLGSPTGFIKFGMWLNVSTATGPTYNKILSCGSSTPAATPTPPSGGGITGTCPSGQAMTGIDASGALICSTLQTSAPAVWVKVPGSGTSYGSGSIIFYYWSAVRGKSPTDYCKSVGYDHATFACKFSYFDGTRIYSAEGTLAANTLMGPNMWAWSCQHGADQWYLSPSDSYIQCQ